MIKIPSPLKPFMPWLFAAALAMTTALMLWPFLPTSDGWIYTDKVEHVLVFIVLTGLGILAYTHWLSRIFIGLMVYGALIELLQAALTSTRQASMADWLADCVGIALGYVIYVYFDKTDDARI